MVILIEKVWFEDFREYYFYVGDGGFVGRLI